MFNLRTDYSFGIPHRVISGCANTGILDDSGQRQLVVATTTNKVVIHESENLLNVNEKILALQVTNLGGDNDVIIVGTASSVFAYDVFKNAYVFQRDMTDGVNCIQIGKLGSHDKLVFCGGNCAIWGLESNGNDAFWTVTGDNVLSLCLCDVDNDGENELIAGSENYDIRIFKGDLMLYEMNETDAVIALLDLGESRFAYALLNGTLGAYKGDTRLWRIKSKNQALALCCFPSSSSSLACAWIHGKIDIRDAETGEVRLKESIEGPVANAFVSDDHFIVVSTDGKVRGFVLDEGQSTVDDGQVLLRELGVKKHNLMIELRNYEQNQGSQKEEDLISNEKRIPASTHLETCLVVNNKSKPPCVELQLAVSSDAVIRAVIIFAEGIFEGESHVVHPTENYTSNLAVQLRPEKDIAVDLHIKAFIGYEKSTQLHVFEVTRAIPRFVMYALYTENAPEPKGHAVFVIDERPPRLTTWMNENFLLAEEIVCEDDLFLKVNFISLRTGEMLIIEMNATGQVKIYSDDMELVGNLIQAIAESFRISEIMSTADFPRDIATLNDLTQKLNDMYTLRDRLSAAMAERVNSVKEMLVRAEDARIIQQWGLMRKYYMKLKTLNQAMVAEHKVRCNNHEQLLNMLRDLNKIIEKGAKLRVGGPASRVVAACREAILQEHFDMLPKIILFGVP